MKHYRLDLDDNELKTALSKMHEKKLSKARELVQKCIDPQEDAKKTQKNQKDDNNPQDVAGTKLNNNTMKDTEEIIKKLKELENKKQTVMKSWQKKEYWIIAVFVGLLVIYFSITSIYKS